MRPHDFLYVYKIVNTTGGNYSEKKCEVSRVKILGANNTFLVLDDFSFTKLQTPTREKTPMYDVVNRPHFCVHFKDWFYGTGFRYSLYSTKPRKLNAIKKFVQKEINKEARLFGQFFDLDFIKQPKGEPK